MLTTEVGVAMDGYSVLGVGSCQTPRQQRWGSSRVDVQCHGAVIGISIEELPRAGVAVP